MRLRTVDGEQGVDSHALAQVKLTKGPADNTDMSQAVGLSTILYIEDNVANVRLVERIIETRPSARLLVEMRGELGLQAAFDHRPTMILLDLNLPDLSGEEVLRRLRADERTAQTTIIVLSADITPGRLQALIGAGANGYLTKPFNISHLLELIDSGGVQALLPVELAPVAVTPLDPRTIAALHRLKGSLANGPAQLRQLVELFLHDCQDRLAALAAATKADDRQLVGEIAHSLAGSSANLGARALADKCRELEREAKSKSEIATAHIDELMTCLDSVRDALLHEFGGSDLGV